MRKKLSVVLMVFAVLASASSAFAQRRQGRAVAHPPMKFLAVTDVEAIMDGHVVEMSSAGVNQITSWFHLFNLWPAGTRIKRQVLMNDHLVQELQEATLSSAGDHWQGKIWEGPPLPEWGTGVGTFRTIVLPPQGGEYIVDAKFLVRAEKQSQLGPLIRAEVDVQGGVILRGDFTDSPVVISVYGMNEMITLTHNAGSFYIPPGVIAAVTAPGIPRVIAVSAPLNGNPYHLESSTTLALSVQ